MDAGSGPGMTDIGVIPAEAVIHLSLLDAGSGSGMTNIGVIPAEAGIHLLLLDAGSESGMTMVAYGCRIGVRHDDGCPWMPDRGPA